MPFFRSKHSADEVDLEEAYDDGQHPIVLRNGTGDSGSNKPQTIQRRELTAVSKKYDLGNKGYLNEAEQELRNMDRDNRGYLTPEQVYAIVESLQAERRAAAELAENIRQEHKRSRMQRRWIAGLCVMAVLLACANIGTSFAAARLAKDTQVSSTNDLVGKTADQDADSNAIIGTSTKYVEFAMQPIPSSRRRHLQETEDLICGPVNSANNTRQCSLQGLIYFDDAVKLYKQFCPRWPNADNVCRGSGVDSVVFNCMGAISTIFGKHHIPNRGPAVDSFAFSFIVFPSDGLSYKAQQAVYPRRNGSSQFASSPCIKDYELGILCPTDKSACFTFGTFDVDGSCPGAEIKLCGEASDIPPELQRRLLRE
jgi:hypothetical protein